MNVQPWTTVRVANSEECRLTLAVDPEVTGAVLTDRTGTSVRLDVEANTLTVPLLKAPNVATVAWQCDGAEFETYLEVVSAHYFPLDRLRESTDGGQDSFLAEASDEELFQARAAAVDTIERNANRSFVRRIGRTKDYGRDRYLPLADGDVSEMLTEGYRLISDCQAVRTCEGGPFPAWVEYVHGYSFVPEQVSRAALVLAAYLLRPSNRPVGATGESTDAGFIRFTTAGVDGATDIPEVNAAIQQWGRAELQLW